MESKRDVFDDLRDWTKSAWPIFVLLFAVAFILLLILPEISKPEPKWDKLSAISTYAYTVITFCTMPVIIATAILALRQLGLAIEQLRITGGQLQEASRTRKLTVLPYLLDSRARSDKSLASRAELYKAYCTSPEQFRYPVKLSPKLRQHCQQIFYDFSEIGIFVDQGLFEPELAKYLLHINPAKMWIILKHYAEYETQQRGYKYYVVPFQYIAKLSFLWAKNAGMQELVITNPHDETLNKTITESQIEKELEQLTLREENPLRELPCCLPCCTTSAVTTQVPK